MQSHLITYAVKPFIISLTFVLASIFGFQNAYAESVAVPVGQQGYNNSVNRPYNGLKKAEVERKYGSPLSRNAAVGNPPISSWVYADYTVYFEYNVVIHSVLNR